MALVNKYRLMSAAGLAALAMAGSPALAQEDDDTVMVDEGDDGATDNTIYVNARRRDEAIEDVPIAITALGTDELARNQTNNPDDLRMLVPGLGTNSLTRDAVRFFIRGQGPQSGTGGSRSISGVQTYFAEVPIDINGPGEIFDMANVQVLKGPQGTLFGRNTTGGAVLFTPATPRFETGGYVEAQYGNYDHFLGEVMGNVEIIPDTLAVRLAAQVQRRDGFTTSILTGQDQDDRSYESFRGSIRIASGGFDNTTIFRYRHQDSNGAGQVVQVLVPQPIASIPLPDNPQLLGALSAILGTPVSAQTFPLFTSGQVSPACLQVNIAGCPAPIFGQTSFGAYVAALTGSTFGLFPQSAYDQINATQAAIGPRQNQNPNLSESRQRAIGVINLTTLELSDSLTLKNIISWNDYRQHEILEFVGIPLPLLRNTGSIPSVGDWTAGQRTFTEELQLQGEIGDNFNFIVGGYYEEAKSPFAQSTFGFQVGNPGPRIAEYDDQSVAVFAHAEWSPIDNLTLSGGIRQTWDERRSQFSALDGNLNCNQTDPATGVITCPLLADGSFDALTYDGTISYRPTPDVLLYASYRRGYKAGGNNLPVAPAAPPLPADFYASYGPEFVDDFEFGFKLDTDLGNMPLRFNGAVFMDDYSDQQIPVSITFVLPNGSTSATSQVQNIAASDIWGFEADLAIQPAPGLVLGGWVSFLDAHASFDVFDPTTGELLFDDDEQLPNQPRWKYGFNAVYDADLGNNGNIVTSFNYSWQDSQGLSPAPRIVPDLPSYGVANAQILWENFMGNPLDVGFFMTNVFDETYAVGGFPVDQLGFTSFLFGEPRMYGLKLRFRFGSED